MSVYNLFGSIVFGSFPFPHTVLPAQSVCGQCVRALPVCMRGCVTGLRPTQHVCV